MTQTLPPAPSSINTGVPPTTYGQGGRSLRGNYAEADSDYICNQNWDRYSPMDHDLYRRLFERQSRQLAGMACAEFIGAVSQLGSSSRIPRFEDLSERLFKATRWEIVAVPGLIPEEAFFSLLSQRRFPVTNWIRNADEFEYVVEPDVFHDLFGHVPLLFDTRFADYMQTYGLSGLKAVRLEACRYLARLYWYTAEFGLIRTVSGLRAYGAGILSSAGELRYSIQAKGPERVDFNLTEVLSSPYVIDAYQAKYFVIQSFEQLFQATATDLASTYIKLGAI